MTAQAGGASPDSALASAERHDDGQDRERNALRRQLRRIRRALSPRQQQQAALAVARQLASLPSIKRGTRIGIYLALPGEVDLGPFIKLAWSRGCLLFAPRISHARRRQMSFHRFTPSSPLLVHRWGMLQLRAAHSPIASSTLDLVLVPLVGFDAQGNRLGMGAGFYDRHFARLRRLHWRRPRLIGVAHACQQVVALVPQPHDVRLEAVVTERGWHRAIPTNTG